MEKLKEDIDKDILEYLADRQGKWTSLWYGYFSQYPEGRNPNSGEVVDDVYYAMPEGVSEDKALLLMKDLYRRDLVGGCDCGCRGDFEITDEGLKFIGRERVTPYTGY